MARSVQDARTGSCTPQTPDFIRRGGVIPRLPGTRRPDLVRTPDGEHIEGDGCGPGLLSGAERLAGERLEVLGEAALRELFEGVAAHALGPLALSRSEQRPPQEPVGDGPDRSAPVAAWVEAGLFGAGRGGQRMAKIGVTGEVVRV